MKFRFGAAEVYYYSEWFDTIGEARAFAYRARHVGLTVDAIEDENEEDWS